MRNFHDEDLPSVNNGTITVKVTYLGDDKEIFVESNPDDFSEEELKKAVALKDKKLGISRLLGYFKIKDGEGNLLTEFKDFLEIKISYSPLAWELARDNGSPRVAHLAREDDVWADNWEEFSSRGEDVIVVSIPPTKEDPYGYVSIKVKSLPDPLIGDC